VCTLISNKDSLKLQEKKRGFDGQLFWIHDRPPPSFAWNGMVYLMMALELSFTRWVGVIRRF
jgi:hypothetical protein